MHTPKITFRYSWIYDQHWREVVSAYGKKPKPYPSERKIRNYVKKAEKTWKKDGKKVLIELSKITGLKWSAKEIPCYIVGKCIPFSDPLTVKVYGKTDQFVDVLTHELIHQLFTQKGNMQKSEKAWKYIHEKYEKESHRTREHIPLYAIHAHVYLKFFGKKRFKRDTRSISFLPDYKRAWEIIREKGYQNILHEFAKRID